MSISTERAAKALLVDALEVHDRATQAFFDAVARHARGYIDNDTLAAYIDDTRTTHAAVQAARQRWIHA